NKGWTRRPRPLPPDHCVVVISSRHEHVAVRVADDLLDRFLMARPQALRNKPVLPRRPRVKQRIDWRTQPFYPAIEMMHQDGERAIGCRSFKSIKLCIVLHWNISRGERELQPLRL